MAFDPALLRTELQTDPQAIGYAPHVQAARDQVIADLLNLTRTGAAYQQFRGVVSAYEIINATDPAEWAALTAQEKQRYQTLTGAGQVDLSNANLRAMFSAMFAANTTTRAALLAIATRTGSRAEVLFGPGVTVTAAQIGAAR
jgi:hypothetical protein